MNHHGSVVALAGIVACAGAAPAGPVVDIGIDLDQNGQIETEGSFLTRTISIPGPGAVLSFDWAFMSSEATADDDVEDVFRVRVYDFDTNEVLHEINGYVVSPGDSGSLFTPRHFDKPSVPGTIVAPSAPGGLTQDTFFEDGAIGWFNQQFVFTNDPGQVLVEFLVADAADRIVDTGLAIDNLQLHEASGAPVPLDNGSFESGDMSFWSLAGEGGTFTFLESIPGESGEGLPASAGDVFALITTTGQVPGPGAAALGAIALGLLGRRRR